MVESAAQRAMRLLDLVPYLNAHPGITVQEVADEFEVSKQDLLKDLNLLFLCGLPGYTALELIDIAFDDGIITVKDPQNLDAPRTLTEQEALTIRLALAGLEDWLPASHRPKVSQLRKKIASIFRSEIPDSAISFRGAIDSQLVRKVEEAISGHRKLRISYLNTVTDLISDRKISPYRLDLNQDRSKLYAWCERAGGWRTFKLTNIRSIEVLPEPADELVARTDPSPLPAKIRISKDSWFARENEGALRIDETGLFQIDIYQPEWLIRTLIASGGDLEIIEPAQLGQKAKEIARRALANYA